ncbi:MAG TPA: class I SAM-dependent methyltransferase [Vicinamibacterales bacterium]|jgi:SAM-dependent methyltransferase
MDFTGGYDDAAVAAFYEHVVPYRNRADVAFFVEEAARSGGPVLELGCGTGRVLIPTARAGIDIVGLDGAPAMLAHCRQRLASEPDAVRDHVLALVDGDMRRFRLDRRFPLITIPFRPFLHLLTVEDQIACLETVRDHLDAGGRLILDLFNPSFETWANDTFPRDLPPEPSFELPDGRTVVRHIRMVGHNPFTQVLDAELVYDVSAAEGGRQQVVHRFGIRSIFRYEAEHLLARCGFEVERLYADYDRSPFGSRYPGELIFIARRR